MKGCGIGHDAGSLGVGRGDEQLLGGMYLLRKKSEKLLKQRIECNVVERWEGCRESTEMAACTKPPEQSLKPALVGLRVSVVCCWKRRAIQEASRKGNNRGRARSAVAVKS